MRRFGLLAVGLWIALACPLSAALITADPGGGVTTVFPGGFYNPGCLTGAGSTTVAGFPMTSTGAWCHDYDGVFGFGQNGSWGGLGLVGDDSGATIMTIDLGGLYAWVGGFMNYYILGGFPKGSPPIIAALAADGVTVLEFYNLLTSAPILTSGLTAVNEGAFRGIQRATADIRYFQFGGSYLAMHNITLSSDPIPEPATGLLVCGALTALAWLRWRLARRATSEAGLARPLGGMLQ